MTMHYSHTVKGWNVCRKTNPWKCYIKDKNCLWGQIWSFMVLFHVHNQLLYSPPPGLVRVPYKSVSSNFPPPLCLSQPACLLPTKMGVYDGVYKLDMTQADPNWAALHKEMGEKDINAAGQGGIGKKTLCQVSPRPTRRQWWPLAATCTRWRWWRTRTAASPPAPTTPSCPTTTQASLLRWQ